MPRQTRKIRRSRTRRNRTRKARRTVNVNKALQPVSQRYICKMKYAEQVTTSAVNGSYLFNLNSVWDPNRTGTGHQPYGFDTLATMYNRYRVISCGYRISIPAGSVNQFLAALPANDIYTFADLGACIETPRVKYVEQGSLGAPIRVLSGKVYMPSLMGRNKSQYMADDRFQAETTANPLEAAILNLFTSTASGIPQASNVNVLLEYTVEFFDPKILPQS